MYRNGVCEGVEESRIYCLAWMFCIKNLSKNHPIIGRVYKTLKYDTAILVKEKKQTLARHCNILLGISAWTIPTIHTNTYHWPKTEICVSVWLGIRKTWNQF